MERMRRVSVLNFSLADWKQISSNAMSLMERAGWPDGDGPKALFVMSIIQAFNDYAEKHYGERK